MTRGGAIFVSVVALAGCPPPETPAVDDCAGTYDPIACVDGQERCEVDAAGCRQCTCDPNPLDRDPPPGEQLAP